MKFWVCCIFALSAVLSTSVFSEEEKEEIVLKRTYSFGGKPLEPRYVVGYRQHDLMYDLGEGLLRLNRKGQREPGMAQSWLIDSANKTITFKLKDNIYWSDGHSVVAEDFILAWHRAAEIGKQHALYSILAKIKGVKEFAEGQAKKISGLIAESEKSFTVIFTDFDRFFLERSFYPSFHPIPSHFAKQYKDSWVFHKDRPYNGAYKIQVKELSKQKKYKIFLEKNKEYYDHSLVQIENIVYSYESDKEASAVKRTLRSYLNPSSDIIRVIKNESNSKRRQSQIKATGHKIILNENPGKLMIFINQEKVKNKKMIEALKYLIDPEIVISRSKYELGVPAYQVFGDNKFLTKKLNDLAKIKNKYAISRKERIKKGLGFLKKVDLDSVSLNLYTFPSAVSAADTLVGYLERYSINIEKIEIQVRDYTSLQSKREKVDMLFFTWYFDTPDISGIKYPIIYSDLKVLGTKDEDLFKNLIKKASKEKSNKQSISLIQEIEDLLIHEGSIIPIAKGQYKYILNSNLCGLSNSGIDYHPSMWLKWCDN